MTLALFSLLMHKRLGMRIVLCIPPLVGGGGGGGMLPQEKVLFQQQAVTLLGEGETPPSLYF